MSNYIGNIISSVVADCSVHLNSEAIDALQISLSLHLAKYNLAEKDYSLVVYRGDENKEIFNKFLASKRLKGLSLRSLKYYKFTLEHVFFAIRKNIKDIGTDDIRTYLACKSEADKVSNVSLNNIKRVLNSFFSWMVNEEYILRNPVSKIETIKEPKRLKKPLSEEEMEILRGNTKNLRDRAIVDVLLSTACRVSELVSINLRDVNFESGTVPVIGKGDKEREVYLNAKAKISLKQYIESRKDKNPALFCGLRASLNKRLSVAGVEIMLRNLGRSAGVDNVHPHRFRRTAATYAHYRGMSINEVSSYLGHASINTTTLYAIMSKDVVKNAHKKFLA